MFDSTGGGQHHTAYIGGNPEHRDWRPDHPTYFPMIDHTARVEAFVTVDAGTYQETFIGARTWLMKHCHVGHDAYIGANCELAPGCIIGGGCVIGEGSKLGMGTIVRPGVNIGTGARTGCGAVVVDDIPIGATYVGNPARPLVKKPEDCRRFGQMPDYDSASL